MKFRLIYVLISRKMYEKMHLNEMKKELTSQFIIQAILVVALMLYTLLAFV